jgi:hypothetical protein
MAILLANFVWEGLSSERLTVEGVKDGHIFKELDTGESYIRIAGVWQFINLGLSYIKATKSGRVVTGSGGIYNVSFITPLVDNNYTVALSCEEVGSQPAGAFFSNLTNIGFRITSRYIKTGNIRPNTVVSWLATRNYNP